MCVHGRRRERCKECGGSSFCVHGRRRDKCKECRSNAAICVVVQATVADASNAAPKGGPSTEAILALLRGVIATANLDAVSLKQIRSRLKAELHREACGRLKAAQVAVLKVELLREACSCLKAA